MAEIELNVLTGQCLNRRIDDIEVVRKEVTAWVKFRNDKNAKVNWQFITEDARIKSSRLYPTLESWRDTSDFIVRTLNKYRPKKDPSEWTFEEIDQLRVENKFSDAILKAVAENCSPNYINKPQLGKYFAEECTADDIPEKVKELFINVRGIIDIDWWIYQM